MPGSHISERHSMRVHLKPVEDQIIVMIATLGLDTGAPSRWS